MNYLKFRLGNTLHSFDEDGYSIIALDDDGNPLEEQQAVHFKRSGVLATNIGSDTIGSNIAHLNRVLAHAVSFSSDAVSIADAPANTAFVASNNLQFKMPNGTTINITG